MSSSFLSGNTLGMGFVQVVYARQASARNASFDKVRVVWCEDVASCVACHIKADHPLVRTVMCLQAVRMGTAHATEIRSLLLSLSMAENKFTIQYVDLESSQRCLNDVCAR
jgi:hypothetical protein